MAPIIQLRGVGVRYRKSGEHITSLKEYAIRWLNGRRVEHHDFWALRHIDLDAAKGEIVGVIGQNGAGKSTLLKVVARVLKPTSGTVRVVGRVAPLLELGAGFDRELTGRENVYLNGAILGFSQREMDAKFERIVKFAELCDFIDAPLRTYSTGMVARLAFSIATDVDPDILLIDEILSVGDVAFQHKCEDRVQGFRRKGTTILLVTHSVNTVRSMCDRALWLNSGRVQAMGDAREVAYMYDEFVQSLADAPSMDVYFHPHWEVTRAELARLLVQALDLPIVTPNLLTFADVSPNAWYFPYVETLHVRGASKGYPDRTFRPNQTVTRGEAVALAASLSGLAHVRPSRSTFEDVTPDMWHYEYIETAYAHGLIEDSEDGLYHPDRGMTRAEAATLAVKLVGCALAVPNTPTFADVSQKEWCYPYVETACLHGLLGSQSVANGHVGNL